MKSAGLPKIEMAGRNLSVPYAPPGAKRIDDDDDRHPRTPGPPRYALAKLVDNSNSDEKYILKGDEW